MDEERRQCDVSVIVLAGGTGRRFTGTSVPKLLTNLKGKPLIAYSLETVLSLEFAHEIVVVCNPSIKRQVEKLVSEVKGAIVGLAGDIVICEGGDSRTASVECGLNYATGRYVMIHDGDRPLATEVLYHRVLGALKPGAGVVPVISPTDAVIQENRGGGSVDYLARNQIVLAQTPQAFVTKEYRAARERVRSRSGQYADDGSIFVANGGNLLTVMGERSNVKVTYPADISLAEFYMDAIKDE